MLKSILWRYSLLTRYLRLFSLLKNWKSIIIQERKRFNGPQILELRNGTLLKTSGQLKIANDVFLEIYHSKCYSKYFPKSTENIVDIGGHFGFFSLQASKLFPNARVIAIEPSPSTYKTLLENIELNKCANILPKQVAIGSQNGVIDFVEHPQNECSGIYTMDNSNFFKVSVKIETLPNATLSFGSEIIDFLKLDCEGAEFDILRNDLDFLCKRVRVVVGEYHLHLRPDLDLQKDLINPLRCRNFEVHYQAINQSLGYFIARNQSGL